MKNEKQKSEKKLRDGPPGVTGLGVVNINLSLG